MGLSGRPWSIVVPRIWLVTLFATAALVSVCGGGERPAATGLIAFNSCSGASCGIYVIGADGSEKTRLTLVQELERDPTWSPDGTRIAFERGGEIYSMNPDGSGQTPLTSRSEAATMYAMNESPAWSPDGTRIAFASAQRSWGEEGPNSKDFDIYLMNADGSTVTRLTYDSVGARGDLLASDVSPAWSADGTRIAFISNREQRWDLYVMNADGSNQTLLVESVDSNSAPAWSPDGRRLAFVKFPESDIYVIDTEDSIITPLTEEFSSNFSPAWSPDGTYIAFVSSRDRNFEIYIMNADGSGQTRLTDSPDEDGHPSWSPEP